MSGSHDERNEIGEHQRVASQGGGGDGGDDGGGIGGGCGGGGGSGCGCGGGGGGGGSGAGGGAGRGGSGGGGGRGNGVADAEHGQRKRARQDVSAAVTSAPAPAPLKRQLDIVDRMWVHPRHDEITFDEERHEYTVAGRALTQSVTGLTGEPFAKFDALEACKRMQRSNWPRPQYADMVDGRLVPWSYERIMLSWEENRDRAAQEGTDLHAMLERVLLGQPVAVSAASCNAVPFSMGVLWWKSMLRRGFRLFAVEAVLWGGATVVEPDGTEYPRIAGSCDLLLTRAGDDEGVVHVVDHKRCKTDGAFFSSSKAMAKPYFNVPVQDCKLSKWRVQANIYAHILSDYGLRVGSMMMVSHYVNDPMIDGTDEPREDGMPLASKEWPLEFLDVSKLLEIPPPGAPPGTVVRVHPRLS